MTLETTMITLLEPSAIPISRHDSRMINEKTDCQAEQNTRTNNPCRREPQEMVN